MLDPSPCVVTVTQDKDCLCYTQVCVCVCGVWVRCVGESVRMENNPKTHTYAHMHTCTHTHTYTHKQQYQNLLLSQRPSSDTSDKGECLNLWVEVGGGEGREGERERGSVRERKEECRQTVDTNE